MAELSQLRRRMIDDMTILNLSPATQRSYVHAVAKFSRHFGRPPDRLGLEDVPPAPDPSKFKRAIRTYERAFAMAAQRGSNRQTEKARYPRLYR